MFVPESRHSVTLRDLVARSIEVIETEQAASGAYPASPTFPVYRFAWLRDGAFVADGVRVHGRTASAQGFHEWAAGVVTARRERIEAVVAAANAGGPVDPGWYLPTRYTVDGADATDDWWDFQLDGYGTWLWALHRALRDGGQDVAPFKAAVDLVVRYLAATWRTPCYDWWEEHPEHVHVATLASVEAGFRAALAIGCLDDESSALARSAAGEIAALLRSDGTSDGRLRKWLGSSAVDASTLAAVVPYGTVSGDLAVRTVDAVADDLLDDGGVHRYREDVFYGGGRWPVLAGLLGQAYARLGRRPDALRQLAWIAGTADGDGLLPEQVSDRLLAADSYEPWVAKWGPVANPLLWSHGGYLALAAELEVSA